VTGTLRVSEGTGKRTSRLCSSKNGAPPETGRRPGGERWLHPRRRSPRHDEESDSGERLRPAKVLSQQQARREVEAAAAAAAVTGGRWMRLAAGGDRGAATKILHSMPGRREVTRHPEWEWRGATTLLCIFCGDNTHTSHFQNDTLLFAAVLWRFSGVGKQSTGGRSKHSSRKRLGNG